MPKESNGRIGWELGLELLLCSGLNIEQIIDNWGLVGEGCYDLSRILPLIES